MIPPPDAIMGDMSIFVVLKQIAPLFLMMAIGIIVGWTRMVDSNFTRTMSAVSMNVLFPASIIKSFYAEVTTAMLREGLSLIIAGGVVLIVTFWLAATTTDSIVPSPETDTTPPAPPIVTAPATDVVTTTEVTFRGLGEEGSTLMLSWSEDDISSVLLVPVPLSPDHDPAAPPQLAEWETTLTLTPGAHLFVLALRDAVGNLSDPTLLSFTVLIPDTSVLPVPLSPGNLLITEVSFDPADPYIELYNPTNKEVILDGGLIELTPFDGTSIPLEGTVSPRSFFLIAPEGRYPEHNTLARDIPFTPATGGIILSSSMIETVDTLPHCPNWCDRAGEGMVIERFSYTLPTNDHFGNWGAPLPLLLSPGASGTPGMRNTLNHLLTMDGTITGHITPDPDLYIVNNNTITIAPASSLTLLAGTTLLFSGEDAKLVSHGTLRATGTADLPVSITSSSSTNDISMSTWVNSGCRSPRWYLPCVPMSNTSPFSNFPV